MSLKLVDLIDLKKSIFAFFPEEVLSALNLEQYVLKLTSNHTIIQEGETLDYLYIPLDSEILLISQHGTPHATQVGSVQPGRAINLYSYLKDLPAQYSFVTSAPSQVLALPKATMNSLWNSHPDVHQYLVQVSQNHDFRTLVKDFRILGLQSNFIVSFISKFEEQEISSQQIIAKFGDRPKAVCFLAEGHYLNRTKNSSNTWTSPLKSWVGWRETIEGKAFSHSVTTYGKSKILSIPIDALLALKTEYPSDFELVDQWIRLGEFRPVETDDVDAEIDDVKELFAEAVEQKVWHLKYPWVRQNDEMDCGAACLSMVSLFFGKDLSVQFWRSKLSTDQSGTTLYDLAKTTEKFGFISHCLEVSDLHEVDHFLFPFIALRKYHYVVVYKVTKDKIVFGDPGIGIREISVEEFKKGFDQVGLFLKPNTDFEGIPESTSAWRHYLHLFSGLEKDIILAAVCAFIGVIISLAPPMISQIILDDVLVQKNIDLLWILLGGSVAISLLTSFITWAENYYFIYLTNKFNFRTASVFVQKIFSLPYHFFATRHVGDFTHRLGEMAHLRQFVTGTLLGVLLNLTTIFIYGGTLFLIQPQLALVVLALAPPMVILPVLFSKYLSRLYGEVFLKSAEQTSVLTDYIKGVALIKSAGAEFTVRTKFENKLIDLLKSQSAFSMKSLQISSFTTGYNQIINLVIMGFCVSMGIKGEMSIGKVLSFTMIAGKFLDPLLSITKQWGQFVEMKSVLARLNDVFLSPSESYQEAKTQKRVTKQEFRGEIEFKEVWFRYGGESTDWVLKGLSFKIEAGQKVALVGPSGSGKSTIALLMARMYEPTQGQILIDGRDYREYDITWLRQQVGLLHQESFLFSGSITENIAFNALSGNENEIQEAAEKAAAADFIQRKGDGFHSYVPPGGLGFSGGEKQKIALARLFYQKPSIVVLDEATSALDGISEEEVLSNLQNQMSARTILNIAHRYTTVKRSDLALVLFEGKFAGFGKISYLKENNPIFQKLFQFTDEPATATPKNKKVA